MNDKERIHIVKQGENLSVIAQKYYGRNKGSHWQEIYEANKQAIGSDPNLIQPGMALKVPILDGTITDTPLLYDFDRVDIWLDRLRNLSGSIGVSVVGVEQYLREGFSEPAPPSAHIQDQKEWRLQKQQIERLGLFNVQLLLYLQFKIKRYVTSILPPEWPPADRHKAAPTYLLRSLFNEASTDAEIIQKAIHQRRLVKEAPDGELTFSSTGIMLALADRLAYRAIKPVAGLMEPGIVTFFSTAMHIRQVPYLNDTILLGIPFACVPDKASFSYAKNEEMEGSWIPIDLLAIPHELGHHIFLHLEPEQKGRYTDGNAPQLSGYNRWIEEIFADIYGCVVAGPISVLGLQAILADALPEEWLHEDGHHPVPALRPFLATDILRQLSQHDTYPATFEQAPDLLDKNWAAILRRQGFISADQPSFEDVTFTFWTGADEKAVTIKQLRTVFSEVIKFYIDALMTHIDKESFKPWSEDKLSLNEYDQVLRDLVRDVREDNNPKELGFEKPDWADDSVEVVQEIKSILSKWNHKGPETGIHGD